MDIDISKWHPIGWKKDFFGRPLQESVTDKIVTIDELMARYNFLLGAAQQLHQAELLSSGCPECGSSVGHHRVLCPLA